MFYILILFFSNVCYKSRDKLHPCRLIINIPAIRKPLVPYSIILILQYKVFIYVKNKFIIKNNNFNIDNHIHLC